MRSITIILLFLLFLPTLGLRGNSHWNNCSRSEYPVELPGASSEAEGFIPIEEISDDTDSDSVHPQFVEQFIPWINNRISELFPLVMNRIPSWIGEIISPPPDIAIIR